MFFIEITRTSRLLTIFRGGGARGITIRDMYSLKLAARDSARGLKAYRTRKMVNRIAGTTLWRWSLYMSLPFYLVYRAGKRGNVISIIVGVGLISSCVMV